MNDIVMWYYQDNNRWYKTWAENNGGEYGVMVKSQRIPESEVDHTRLRTQEQASLTPIQLLNEAKKLY